MTQARERRRVGLPPHDRVRVLLRGFRDNALGTTAIEYGMIGFLIFAVAAGAIKVYGTRVNNVYNTIGTTISQAQ